MSPVYNTLPQMQSGTTVTVKVSLSFILNWTEIRFIATWWSKDGTAQYITQ